MNFRRLYRLCDYMESLPKSAVKHFSMRMFYEHKGDGHDHPLPTAPTTKDLHACGTTACALGWAMTVPTFRRAGLWIEVHEPLFKDAGDTPEYFVNGTDEAFDIDEYQAEWDELFGGDNNDKSPKAWAKRVRKLLKEWQTEAKRHY